MIIFGTLFFLLACVLAWWIYSRSRRAREVLDSVGAWERARSL